MQAWHTHVMNCAVVVIRAFHWRSGRPSDYTPWAIKTSQLIFVCNCIKNQQILMQFSLLDLEMNDTCDSMNFTHLT